MSTPVSLPRSHQSCGHHRRASPGGPRIPATAARLRQCISASSSIDLAFRFRRSRRAISVEPEPPNRSSTQSPPLLSVQQRALDEVSTGFIVGCRRLAAGFFSCHKVDLRLVAVPGIALSGNVAIEDGFVLELAPASVPKSK